MNRYKHIFFDLDRTLWDFETNSASALQKIFHLFHLDEYGEITIVDFVSKYKEINEKMWALYRKGYIKKSELRKGRFTQTLVFFKIKDKRLGAQLDEAYISLSPHHTALVEGATEILDYLKERYQLHIITNGFEEVQFIKLNKSGIRDHFDVIVTSERAKARKPDAEVFQLAMLEAGTQPADSLMIGDDLDSDIIGARNVWMDQVYYNPERLKHEEDITHEITNLRELKTIL